MSKRKKNGSFLLLEEKIALSVIIIFHLVGAALLMFGKGGLYQVALDLVPVNLIFTSLVVFKYQNGYTDGFFKFAPAVFALGLFAEMIGVNYGFLFGQYEYGEVLGIGIWNTPLVIGLNWLLVCYGVGNLFSLIPTHPVVQWAGSVLGLLLFDYFMEPIAMKHNFWIWEGQNIPLQNYVGWALVGGLVMAIFFKSSMKKGNKVAGLVWLVQFFFFVGQNCI